MEKQTSFRSSELTAYLAAVIESSYDAIITKDLNGIITSWNPGAERVFGYSAQEMIGRPIRTIIPPNKQAEEDEIIRRIANGERVNHFETIRVRKDGSHVFVSLTISPVKDGAGRILGASKIARDISVRKLNDLRIAAERKAFQSLAEGASLEEILAELIDALEGQEHSPRASVLLLDEDRTHLRHAAAPSLPDKFNESVSGLPIGPTAGSCGTAAFLGKPVIVADIESDPLWAPFPELRALALSSNLRACWSTPIFSSHGTVLGTFALYYSDVRVPTADQLQFTEELGRAAATLIELRRASDVKARLSALVNSSDDVIIGMTPDGVVRDWNPAARRLYGYEPYEMVGQPITRIVPSEEYSEFLERINSVRLGKSVASFDCVGLDKDGRRVDVSVGLSPVVDEYGHVIGISAIHRDIEERRSLERLQHEFLAMVTHELRNPLTAIMGFASYLQRTKAFSQEAVDTLQEESWVLERLVNDLLDASRVQVGQLQLTRSPVDIVELVQACFRQAQQSSPAHSFVTELPQGPLVGNWDGVRIGQALMNLLNNAVKYSVGGEILVRVEGRSTGVQVDVVDHGNGIAAEHLPHLFERFYRVDPEQHTPRSVGLGLYIARGIVEGHGGNIWVQSDGEGKGSTFSFNLPYDEASA